MPPPSVLLFPGLVLTLVQLTSLTRFLLFPNWGFRVSCSCRMLKCALLVVAVRRSF
jgi:hypothetical protein